MDGQQDLWLQPVPPKLGDILQISYKAAPHRTRCHKQTQKDWKEKKETEHKGKYMHFYKIKILRKTHF